MSEPQLREEQTLNVTAEKTPSSASVAMVPKETYMMKANLVAAPSIAPVPLMKSKEHVQFHPPTPTEKQAPVSFEVGEAKSSITSSLEKIVVHKVGESPQEGQNGSDFNAQPKSENTKTSDGTQPPQNGFDNRPQADAIEEVKPEPIIIPVSMSPCRSPDSTNEGVNGTTTSFEDKKEVTMEATVTFSKSFDDSSTNDVTQILAPNQPSSGATGTKPEELAQKAPETGDQTPKVASQEGQPPVDEVNNRKDEQGLPEAGKDGNTSTGATMNGAAISSEVTIESKSQSFDYVALVNGLSTGENGKSEVVGGLVASTIPEEKKDEEALEKKINVPVLACELRKCPEDEKTDGQTGLQASQDKPSDTDASPLPAVISDIVSHKPDFNDFKSTEMTTVVTINRKEEKSKYDDDEELPERPRSSADLIAAAQAAAAELSALSQAAEHELLQYRRSESRKASVGAGDSLRKRDDSLSDNSAQNSTALDVTPQNSLAEPIPELPTDEKRISAISAEADALRAAIEAANIPIVADDKPKVEEPVEKKVDEVEAKKPFEEMDQSVEKKDGEVKTQPDSTLEEPKRQDQAEQQAQAPAYASLVGGLITTESGSVQVVGGLVLTPVTKQAQKEEPLVQKPKEQGVETKEPEEVQQDANPIEGAQGNDQKPLDQVLASHANASDDKKADDSTSGHPSGEAPTIPESFLELKHKEPEHNELPFECKAPTEPSPSSGDVDEKKEETAVGSDQQKTEEPKVESGKTTPPVIPEIIVDLAHKEPEHTELPFQAVAPSEPSPAEGGDEKQENAGAKPDDAQKTEAARGNEAQKADSGSEVSQSAQTSQDNEKSNDQPSTDITVNADVTIQRVEQKPIEADQKNEVALGSADSPKKPESAEISVESFDAKPVEAKEEPAKPEEKPSDAPKEPSIHVSETPKPSEDEKKPCEEKPTESADAAKAEQREQEQKSAVEAKPECSGAEASASAENAHSNDEVKLSESMSAEPSAESKLAEAGEKATEAVEANKDEQKPSEKLTAQETKPAEQNVEPKAEESKAATEDKPSVPVEYKPSETISSDTSTDKKPEEKTAEESKPVEEQKPAQSIPPAKEEQPTVNEANNIAWISDADDAKPKVELQGAAEEVKGSETQTSGTEASKPAEEPKPTEEPKPAAESKPTEESKSAEEPKQTEESKSAEEPKQTEESKSAEGPKPTEEPKPAEESKPTEESKSAEEPKPTEESKSAEESKPPEEPKPTEDSKASLESKPVDEVKRTEQTKSVDESKPVEEAKPAEEQNPTDVPKLAEDPKPVDGATPADEPKPVEDVKPVCEQARPQEKPQAETAVENKAEETKPIEEAKPGEALKPETTNVPETPKSAPELVDAQEKPVGKQEVKPVESKPTPSALPDDGIEWICDDGKKKDPEPQAPAQEKVPEPAEAAPVESAKPAAMKEEPKEEAKKTQPAPPSDLEQGCEKLREVPTICESAPAPSSPPKDDNHINFDIDQYEKKMNEKTEEMKALVDKLFDKSQQAKKNNEALAKMALEVAADPPTQHHKKRVSFDAMAFGPIGGGLPSHVESVILGRNVLVHPTGVDILPDGNILVTDKERGIFLFSIEGEIVKHLQNESWKEPCAPYAHRSYVLLVQSVRNGDGFWERMICKFSLDMNLISRIECPMWIKENMPVVVSERICVSPAENIYLTVNADTFTGLYELTPGGQWTELDYKLDERFTDICAFCIVGPVTQILVIEGRKNYVHLYSIINGQVAERRKLGVVERPGAITQDEEGNLFVLNKAAACIFTVDTLSWCAHKAVTVVDQVITHFACSRGLIAVPLRDCVRVQRYEFRKY